MRKPAPRVVVRVATLQTGEEVRVELPGEKLHLKTGFAVENGSEVGFVFDVTVKKAGNSG